MAPWMAIARFAFPMTQADHDLISWYFEVYRNDPAEPGAGRPAARAGKRNPKIIIDLTEAARHAGCTSSPEFERFIAGASGCGESQTPE
jgi:hypothetical protein